MRFATESTEDTEKVFSFALRFNLCARSDLYGRFLDLGFCFVNYVGYFNGLAVALDRAQCRVHDRNGDVAVVRRELLDLAAHATCGEHVELRAEHVARGQRDFFALGVTVLAALNV